jgi:DNA (cytosine-5)-methyltransferase 1
MVSILRQAKIGLMVAGCYGLPQFRMRCFLYGACSDEVLPPFPLPTHSVIVRGGVPNLWERCLVAYVENQQPEWLQKPLVLKDAISDLPPVSLFTSISVHLGTVIFPGGTTYPFLLIIFIVEPL